MKKKLNRLVIGVTFFLLYSSSTGQDIVQKEDVVKNENKVNDAIREKGFYIGTAIRAKSAEMAFGQRGKVVEIKPVGFTGNSQVCDNDGRVIVKGDILARLDPRKYELTAKQNQAMLAAVKSTFKKEKENYERAKKLAGRGTISKKLLEEALEHYETATAAVTRAEANLSFSEYELEACNLRAPFWGRVEKHYISVGTPVDSGKPVMRYSLMSPIKIRVFLPAQELKNISVTKPIKVYPNRSGKPVTAWFDERCFGADYIDFYVKNKLVPVFETSDSQRNLPKVNKIRFITTVDIYKEEVPAWAPLGSIRKDTNGFYVWKAKGQKAINPQKPISRTFTVEKIPVKPFNRFMNLGIYNYQALKDCGSLERHDIVLIDVPEKLKEGDTVMFEELRWEFRPNEKVKVYIPTF